MLRLLENSESDELQDLLYEKVGELFSSPQTDDEVAAYRDCLKALNVLVTRCNEGARHRDRQDQLVKINQNLDFK